MTDDAEQPLKADYLVVGAGAMGFAFTDEILTGSPDATVLMIDSAERSGGHWIHAYPFVRLHQPSAYYGVSSRELGSDRIDTSGRNIGLRELADKQEILAYFDAVLDERFRASGRVRFLPRHQYLGDGSIRDLVSGRTRHVEAGKIVDASYMHVKVPAIEPPRFRVAEGVSCVPPNTLAEPGFIEGYEVFTVIGAGKTAFDAILYLFDLGVAPNRIHWVKPRESWLLDRANVQPEGTIPGVSVVDWVAAQASIATAATSLDDFMLQSEKVGAVLRIDPDIQPTMFRCATVSQIEVVELRAIRQVIRKGRVTAIDPGVLHCDEADVPMPTATVYINCTSDGLEKRPLQPVFNGRSIVLQAVRACQQVFSAAMIGFVETSGETDAVKNDICRPVQHPDETIDYLTLVKNLMENTDRYAARPEVLHWLAHSRLETFITPATLELLNGSAGAEPTRLREQLFAATQRIEAFLRSVDEKEMA